MRGRKRCCWAGEPKAISTGASILRPNGMMRGVSAAASSSSKMYRRVADQPQPPCSTGHDGAIQPLRYSRRWKRT